MSRAPYGYLKEQPIPLQIRYFERSWGALPYIAIDITETPGHGAVVVVTAAIHHPLLRAELAEPSPQVEVRRLTNRTDVQDMVATVLSKLEEDIKTRMA